MPTSAFEDRGFKSAVADVIAEAKALYLADDVPWVVGYSGGKDSTAVLQLVWLALASLPAEQRRKTVHVITTDTLVEKQSGASWVSRSRAVRGASARANGLPIEPPRLTPA